MGYSATRAKKCHMNSLNAEFSCSGKGGGGQKKNKEKNPPNQKKNPKNHKLCPDEWLLLVIHKPIR